MTAKNGNINNNVLVVAVKLKVERKQKGISSVIIVVCLQLEHWNNSSQLYFSIQILTTRCFYLNQEPMNVFSQNAHVQKMHTTSCLSLLWNVVSDKIGLC